MNDFDYDVLINSDYGTIQFIGVAVINEQYELYIQAERVTDGIELQAGFATNTGIKVTNEADFDNYFSLDENLSEFISDIEGEFNHAEG